MAGQGPLQNLGCILRLKKNGGSFGNPTGCLLLHMLAAISEFRRDLIKNRAAAKDQEPSPSTYALISNLVMHFGHFIVPWLPAGMRIFWPQFGHVT